MELLTPEEILRPACGHFSIICRIDELREQGVEVNHQSVDQRVRDILAMIKKRVPIETHHRGLDLGVELLESMHAPKDSPTALATFLIIGNIQEHVAAWRYELTVGNPFYQSLI